MRDTLIHIPLEVAPGLPVFGFGLLLALWAMGSLVLLGWMARRQGLGAALWGYLPLLLLFGAIIGWLLPALCDSQGLPIRSYGVMLVAGVLSATALAVWRAKRLGLDPEVIYSLAFWLFVPGFLGARAFYVVHYWGEQFLPTYHKEGLLALLGALVNVAQGGLVVYGALLGIVPGLWLFVRKYRLPLLSTADVVAPSLMLGLALGRIGCLLNGCCFGGLCEHSWAITFPKESGRPDTHSPPYLAQVARGQMYGFLLARHERREDNQRHPQWVIEEVYANSPAAAAGLQPGDRVQQINGYDIKESEEPRGLCGCGAGCRKGAEPHVPQPSAGQILSAAFDNHEPVTLRVEGRGLVRLAAIEPRDRSRPVHPTQIYSAIDAALLCLLLLAYHPFARRDGQAFALMVTIYPVTRFLVEMLRRDEPKVFGTGMTIAQNFSLLLLIFAAGLWFTILRRPPKKQV